MGIETKFFKCPLIIKMETKQITEDQKIDVDEEVNHIIRKRKMKKQFKRQAMSASINELRNLANELEKEAKDINEILGQDVEDMEVDYNQSWLIAIINKQPECSDTWRFE